MFPERLNASGVCGKRPKSKLVILDAPHEGQGLKISADMGVPSERAFKYLPDGEKIVQKFELVMKRDACNR